jgi:hypothetical protein
MSRHRVRGLERMLQQGKFDDVPRDVSHVITDIKASVPSDWQPPIDSLGFAHEREAMALATMSGTETENGYVVASQRPTRLQRQRHQLNQLTFDAKIREYELMDRKGAAMKSKRETQAKYGW